MEDLERLTFQHFPFHFPSNFLRTKHSLTVLRLEGPSSTLRLDPRSTPSLGIFLDGVAETDAVMKRRISHGSQLTALVPILRRHEVMLQRLYDFVFITKPSSYVLVWTLRFISVK